MDTVVVNGLKIAYTRAGHGAPVVLLGGFVGGGEATWRHQIKALSTSHTVVAWDAPGSGESSDPAESFRLPDYADCLAGLVSALHLGPTMVVGLSFGGALAIEFFRRHRPLVRGLFLAGAYAGWAGSLSADTVRARLQTCLDASRLSPSEFATAMLPSMFSAGASTERFDELAVNVQASFHPTGFCTMARASAEADLRDVLPTIDVPTLILHGDQDVRSPREVADGLSAAIHGAQQVVLAGVGHASCLEAPEQFTAELQRFISDQ